MKAEIYSKPNCPFCVRAKRLMDQREIEYVEISAVDNREALIERVVASGNPAPRMVPQIFVDSEYVGGFEQLEVFLSTPVPTETVIECHAP